eukprot:TRINITY_DN16286_c0_g1_i1.p1 TRINITY_DN16286_c0_g1~~TRINITY_DN16286_c0_g1_i1.p1  ORF type:complete len:243 (-),score=45.80 TRINITY_DN16286_c0_g1_i1:248-976(-)
MGEHKIAILGERGVGKSSLFYRYTQDIWAGDASDERHGSYLESLRKQVEVDGEGATVDAVDVRAHRGEFIGRLMDLCIGAGEGFVLVYSITDKASYEKARQWRSRVLDSKGGHHPIAIVASKCDLEHERVVSREEGEALAQELLGSYVEVSAKEDINVGVAFDSIVRELRGHSYPRDLIPPAERQHSLCTIVWCLEQKTRLPPEVIQFLLGFVERLVFKYSPPDERLSPPVGGRRQRRCALQ